MSYAYIDPVISAWAERHALSLYTGIESDETAVFRCVYISSNNGKCCQIWIDPPISDEVALHAAGVETHLDEEMRQDWHAPVSDLENALENALTFVKRWMER